MLHVSLQPQILMNFLEFYVTDQLNHQISEEDYSEARKWQYDGVGKPFFIRFNGKTEISAGKIDTATFIQHDFFCDKL